MKDERVLSHFLQVFEPSVPLTISRYLQHAIHLCQKCLPSHSQGCISFPVSQCSNSHLFHGMFLNYTSLVWPLSHCWKPLTSPLPWHEHTEVLELLLFLCFVFLLDYKLSEAKDELSVRLWHKIHYIPIARTQGLAPQGHVGRLLKKLVDNTH